jgi:mono/diheme cytochrome c family protein
VIPFAGAWYISTLPAMARELSMGAAPAVTIFAGLSIFFSLLVVIFTYFGPYRRSRAFNLTFALLIAVLALSTTGVTEWVREAVRKPYIIYNYMYGNTLRVEDLPRVRQQGILASARFVRRHAVEPGELIQSGEDIFSVQCASCHTVDGYNSIRFAVKGWSPEMIDYLLLHLNELTSVMPPFVGSEAERRALGAWLITLNPRPLTREPAAPGEKAQASPSSLAGENTP